MTNQLLVHADDSQALGLVSEYLHDARYSLDGLIYDETKRTVSIPFKWDAHLKRRTRGDSSHFAWNDGIVRWLTVSNVDHVDIDDPAGLVEHSFAHMAYGDGTLTLASNFPGSIRMNVSGLDVHLEEQNSD